MLSRRSAIALDEFCEKERPWALDFAAICRRLVIFSRLVVRQESLYLEDRHFQLLGTAGRKVCPSKVRFWRTVPFSNIFYWLFLRLGLEMHFRSLASSMNLTLEMECFPNSLDVTYTFCGRTNRKHLERVGPFQKIERWPSVYHIQSRSVGFFLLLDERVGNSSRPPIGARGWHLAKLIPRSVRRREKLLVPLFAILLTRKCCLVLIKLPLLPLPCHSHHCLQAWNRFCHS